MTDESQRSSSPPPDAPPKKVDSWSEDLPPLALPEGWVRPMSEPRSPSALPHDMSRVMTVGELRKKLADYGADTVVMIQGPNDETWPMAAWVGTDEDEETVYLPARAPAVEVRRGE